MGVQPEALALSGVEQNSFLSPFPAVPFSGEIFLISPVRELGGTSTIHLAVAGGVHIGRGDGLRRRALRLQERVGYPVAESQQAGSGQCYRQGAAPPDGVG